MRNTRPGVPAMTASRQVMNGKASFETSRSGDQRADDLARARPDDRDRRPLLGDARRVDPQLRPLGLEPLLEVVEDGRGVAGRRRHVEPVVGRVRVVTPSSKTIPSARHISP